MAASYFCFLNIRSAIICQKTHTAPEFLTAACVGVEAAEGEGPGEKVKEDLGGG